MNIELLMLKYEQAIFSPDYLVVQGERHENDMTSRVSWCMTA